MKVARERPSDGGQGGTVWRWLGRNGVKVVRERLLEGGRVGKELISLISAQNTREKKISA